MTNSYNMAMPYAGNAEYQGYSQANAQIPPQMYPQGYYSQTAARSVIPAVAATSFLGFLGGAGVTALVQYFKNRHPVNSSGEVSESYAKRVLDKIIKKDYVSKGKEYFKQGKEVLKKLGKISKPEEFSKLMNKNKKFCSSMFDGISLNTVCQTVTKDNIKGKISALKDRIEAGMKQEIRNIQDTIALCWDKENKKFVKPKAVEEKIFKVIKNTKNEIPWLKAAKYGGITAGVFGALTLGYAIFAGKSQQ